MEPETPETPKTPDKSDKSKGGFWSTMPGVITAIAGLLTAVGGLIAALHAAGLFASKDPVHTPEPPIVRIDTGLPHDSAANGSDGLTPGKTTPLSPLPPKSTGQTYPVEWKITASAVGGEYQFQVLSARLEEHGTDPNTHGKTLLLGLAVKETFHSLSGTGYFSGNGFRLIIDGDGVAPLDGLNENIDKDTSMTRKVQFVVPESAKNVILRVGYYDTQRTDIPLSLIPPLGTRSGS